MSYDEYQGGGLRSISLFGVFVGVAAVGALALSLLAYTQTHHDRAQVKALQAYLQARVYKGTASGG